MPAQLALVWRGAVRNRALLLPATVVLTLSMGLSSALVALVLGVVADGGSVGALTVFLAISVVGLLAVVLSMFGVVRAALSRSLETVVLMGAGPARTRLLMAGLALFTGLVGSVAGAFAALPVYGGLFWMMRSTGYHGLPSRPPQWSASLATGVALTAALAMTSGALARPVRPGDGTSRRGWVRWVRLGAGVVLLAGELVLARVPSVAALALGGLLGLLACVALAPTILEALCWLLSRIGLGGTCWPVALAGHALGRRRSAAAVTVGSLAVALFCGATAVVGGAEQIARAGIADGFRPDAQLVTAPDGRPLDPATAHRLCAGAESACAGLLWLPEDGWTAVITPEAGTVLMAAPPVHGTWRPAGATAPWDQLVVGQAPTTGHWLAVPVLRAPVPRPAGTAVTSARDWARSAPSEVVVRGSGTADIGPMLMPLLLLAGLFGAAAAYTTFAGQGRTLATLGRAGAGRTAVGVWTLAEALVSTTVVFGLGALLWVAIGGHAAAIGRARGLEGPVGMALPPTLGVAAALALVLLAGLSGAGARQSRHVTA